MFCPGETIRHTFIIPFLARNISKIVVTYKFKGDVFFEKVITSDNSTQFQYYEPAENENKTKVSFILSQDESLLFPENDCYTIQINVLTLGNSRHSCTILKEETYVQQYQELETHPHQEPDKDVLLVDEAFHIVFG